MSGAAPVTDAMTGALAVQRFIPESGTRARGVPLSLMQGKQITRTGQETMALDLRGIIVPVVTVFNEDESVHEDGFKSIVNYFIEHGAAGIFVAGGQGEGVSLSTDEKMQLLDLALETVNGRVPVLMGTGAVSTRASIDLTRQAK